MIAITITPAGPATYHADIGDRRLGAFRTPLLSAARILAAEGIEPNTPIAMRWAGSQTISMQSTVGAAAALTVVENDGPPRFAQHRALQDAGMPFAPVRSARQRPEALAA